MLNKLRVPTHFWPVNMVANLIVRLLGVALGVVCFILGMGLIMSLLGAIPGLLLIGAGFALIVNCVLP